MDISELVFFIFEMIGTVAFAVSGAMIAISKKTDIFGVVFLSVITAVGGGILRDILIGTLPPRMFVDYRYVAAAFITSLLVFIAAYIFREDYQKRINTFDSINNIFDSIGLGVFTVSGSKIAIESGFAVNGILVVCMAVLTGVGGGILRDAILGEVPFVLKKRIYALASVIGAIGYYIMYSKGMNIAVATVIAVAIVFVIRICATVFKWDLPKVDIKTDN
ncbi:MAG: trimeric intracellular cation channel family protein [Clostridia bacterium]|nr:trimeric intracellular cation channel family protein [Clostridia bacterium]